jgi:hypothetical protein
VLGEGSWGIGHGVGSWMLYVVVEGWMLEVGGGGTVAGSIHINSSLLFFSCFMFIFMVHIFIFHISCFIFHISYFKNTSGMNSVGSLRKMFDKQQDASTERFIN